MRMMLSSSFSNAFLGGLAVWAFLSVGGVLVWAAVIAWGCFFHAGGDSNAVRSIAVAFGRATCVRVIDAYDTMTDAGRDRASVEPAGAVSELLRCGGTQFDPEALDAFLAVLGRH